VSPLATVSTLVAAAPVSFVLGVIVGLGLASRYRIVRVKQKNGQDK
jgi:hypothetical protein